MNRIVAVVLLTLSTLVAQQKFVSTKGEHIVLPDGKPILLRGINLGNWLVPEGYMFKFTHTNSPQRINETFNQLLGPEETKKFWKQYRDNYITKEDIAYIKKIGLNSIRVPFNYRLFVSEDHDTRFAGPGFEMLDRVIKWCKEENLYVILDMHCAPGGQTGDNIDDSYGYPFLFESEEAQQLTVDLWKEIAMRYANETIVIGYDFLNEPIATYFDASKFNHKLEPFYKRITAAVREVDTNHIVFLGGAQWNGNFSVFGPPFDKKIVYTYHRYWCDTTQAMVQEFADFMKKYDVPIWMGESGENSDQWIDAWRRLNEKNNFGWCFWPYKKMDATSNIVSVKRTAEWDSVITYANKPRTSYKDIRDAKPHHEVIKKAFSDYLENCTFKNCVVNDGYIKALGLKVHRISK
ncbi:MAG: cellulase family glycosylhydrolase [Ignavibacteriales bacterium]|nr:cellulase family glycosylhydrolase [Ignavibacteriales bacterium]